MTKITMTLFHLNYHDLHDLDFSITQTCFFGPIDYKHLHSYFFLSRLSIIEAIKPSPNESW